MVQTNAGRGEPARRRRRRWTAAEKAGYLKQFAASGLSLKVFCREHGLSRTMVGRWRRAARAAPGAVTPSRGSGFAAVTLKPIASLERRERSVGLTMVVRWPSGMTAELAGLDDASAGAVVTTLASLARTVR